MIESKEYEKISEIEEEFFLCSFIGDLFVFDQNQEGRIVGGRSPACRRLVGRSMSEFLSEEKWSELSRHLLSYDSRAMVLDSELGIFVIFPQLMPSSAMGLAWLPGTPRTMTLRFLFRQKLIGIAWNGTLAEEGKGRFSAVMKRQSEGPEEELGRIVCAIEGLWIDNLRTRKRVDQALADRLTCVSKLVGCPTRLIRQDSIIAGGEFDMGLATLFLLLSLLLCREYSLDRCAEISFEEHTYGGAIAIRIPLVEKETLTCWEYLSLAVLAERYRMLFEKSENEEALFLRFAPIRRDWSLLGLKAEPEFDWER